jgi:hypothetical protein
MTNELAKTISTSSIWIATAVILTFGLFRMSGDFLFFFCVSVVIAGAAAGSTALIWQSDKKIDRSGEDPARPEKGDPSASERVHVDGQ